MKFQTPEVDGENLSIGVYLISDALNERRRDAISSGMASGPSDKPYIHGICKKIAPAIAGIPTTSATQARLMINGKTAREPILHQARTDVFCATSSVARKPSQ